MNINLNPDLLEATRLTRTGNLTEAMALLRGVSATAKGPAPSHDDGNVAKTPRTARSIVDMFPPAGVGGAWTSALDTLPRSSSGILGTLAEGLGTKQVPEALRGFLDRVGQLGSGLDLSALDGLAKGTAAKTAAPLPEGARFDDRLFANEAGSRPYKLYIPSTLGSEPVPLVVMLHGCTQSPDDFAAGTRMNELAEEHRILVAYPGQPSSANHLKCWNWFNSTDQQRDRGEPSLIAGITREVMRDFPVDPERVYVAGLSAGGAAAAIMGSVYPDLYAAVCVHSGLACGAASDMPSAFNAMRQGGAPHARTSRTGSQGLVPTIVFHGDQDKTVSPVNGNQVIAQSKAGTDLRRTVIRGKSESGATYTCTVQADEQGRPALEHWVLHGAGHAWSGGSSAGSYTDPRGPDASREMLRFFLAQRNGAPQ
jgi:poly(hydroxyalkanoate) depolymerase family esterase